VSSAACQSSSRFVLATSWWFYFYRSWIWFWKRKIIRGSELRNITIYIISVRSHVIFSP
jgi:hypothetical protein